MGREGEPGDLEGSLEVGTAGAAGEDDAPGGAPAPEAEQATKDNLGGRVKAALVIAMGPNWLETIVLGVIAGAVLIWYLRLSREA